MVLIHLLQADEPGLPRDKFDYVLARTICVTDDDCGDPEEMDDENWRAIIIIEHPIIFHTTVFVNTSL